MFRPPKEGSILFGEIVQRASDLGKVFDKSTIKVGEPNETSDFFEVPGCRPGGDSFNFRRVHTDFTGTDNQSEVLDFGLFELAFLGPKVQIVLLETTEDLVDNLAVLLEIR